MIDHLESWLLTPGGYIPLLVAEASTSNTFFILLIYSLCIVGAAIFGGWLPYVVRLTHTWMQLLISLVGGLILGIAIFHLLPHSLAELGPDGVDTMATCLMAGLLVMFLLLRAFHFHHHEPVIIPEAESLPLKTSLTHSTAALDDAEKLAAKAIADQLLNPPSSNLPALPVLTLAPAVDTNDHSSCDHSHDHHGHHHGHDHHTHSHRPFGQRWIPVMFGLCLHSMLDGLAVAASVEADAHHGHGGFGGLFGIGTFLAVLLHTPLDAMSISALLGSNRWRPSTRLLIVAGFAAMCPLGAYLFWAGYQLTGGSTGVVVGGSLAFAAGLFLCISLSDLLPEMEFHSHNRIQLTAALLAGIGIAYAIGFLEPHHAHHFEGPGIVAPQEGSESHDADSDHAGHSH